MKTTREDKYQRYV